MFNQTSKWSSACAQHATIAQALLFCPCVENGEIFTLWSTTLEREMRATWEEVYGIHSSRTPTSLKPGLWPHKPLIYHNYRGWEPLKMIVQRKAGFCLC